MHIILPMPRIMQDIAGASWLWITGHTRIIGWSKGHLIIDRFNDSSECQVKYTHTSLQSHETTCSLLSKHCQAL